MGAGLDISCVVPPMISYDSSSKAVGTGKPLFSDVAVSELLFLGSTETDVWTQLEFPHLLSRDHDIGYGKSIYESIGRYATP